MLARTGRYIVATNNTVAVDLLNTTTGKQSIVFVQREWLSKVNGVWTLHFPNDSSEYISDDEDGCVFHKA